MSKQTSDKRAQAASLIRQALDLGVRKELRAALEHALELAEQGAPKELTQLHYDRLKPNARLADPNRRGLIMKATGTGIKRWLYRTTDPATGKQIGPKTGDAADYPKSFGPQGDGRGAGPAGMVRGPRPTRSRRVDQGRERRRQKGADDRGRADRSVCPPCVGQAQKLEADRQIVVASPFARVWPDHVGRSDAGPAR